jgi:putative transposase
MWTDTTRAQYARAQLTLPSDLTDAEWAVLEPFFPSPAHVGRPRKWRLRRIVEAILYLLRGGLPWRILPPCFPPVSTLRTPPALYLWRDNGPLAVAQSCPAADRPGSGRTRGVAQCWGNR